MESRYQACPSHILFVPSQRRTVVLNQLVRLLVMSLQALGFTHIVQQGSGEKSGAQALAFAVVRRDTFEDSGSFETVIQLQRKAGDPLRVREVGVERIRP